MKIRLIIGLGNPGKEYANTYHNVGCLFVDHVKDLQKNNMIDAGLALISSRVYVNDSGKFVAKELKRAGAKPEELLVVHDDSDIEIGKYKFALASAGRGAAGHHGIESIQKALKSNNFPRLRIGIRRPTSASEQRMKAGEFVLNPISKENHILLKDVFSRAIEDLKKNELFTSGT